MLVKPKNEPSQQAFIAIGASFMHEDLQHGIVVLLNKFHPKPDSVNHITSIGIFTPAWTAKTEFPLQ